MNNSWAFGLVVAACALLQSCAPRVSDPAVDQASSQAPADGSLLRPGSPAPPLDVREWVKGQPVSSFEPGRAYVVEFWASWCGPCAESVPLMTSLARKHTDVRFLGISVFEPNDKGQVRQFVEFMGDKMDYTVGYSGDQDRMAQTWMAAAKQNGVPTAFIVKDGVIAWIGSPFALQTPLAQLAEGRLDIAASRKTFEASLAARERRQKQAADLEECVRLYDAGDIAAAKLALGRIEQQPDGKAASAELRFRWLCIESPAEWRSQAAGRLASSTDDGSELAVFANENATRAPEACRWLIREVTSKFPANWYGHLCGARMAFKQKDHAAALAFAEGARRAILEYRRLNPDAPQGNAMDVIADLEAKIRAERP